MRRRPLAVTILSWLFLATGVVGFVFHFLDYRSQHAFGYDAIWILSLRALAVVCGVFMLRGSNWARWVTILWLAFHVGIGALHSLPQALVHVGILAVFVYFLFRPEATKFFGADSGNPPQYPDQA